MIPLIDLRADFENIRTQIDDTIKDVLNSAQFINGPNVQMFEKEFARYIGSSHSVSVNSGTDALSIGLEALGIGPGDEVITTDFTFFATVEAILKVGAKPILVDISKGSFNLDYTKIEEKITPNTRAIIVVHLFGEAVNMSEIMQLAQKYHLKVIEDVAQASGAEWNGKKVGSFGDIGAFSFFPSKNLGGFGDGGMICSSSASIAEKCKMIKEHGSKTKYHNEIAGCNSRLDEIQAAVLRVKLPHLESNNTLRQNVAEIYNDLLSKVSEVTLPNLGTNRSHVFNLYTIRVNQNKRIDLQAHLKNKGVSSGVYYPIPMHSLEVLNKGTYQQKPGSFANTDLASKEVLSIPFWPKISIEIQEKVCKAIASFFKVKDL